MKNRSGQFETFSPKESSSGGSCLINHRLYNEHAGSMGGHEHRMAWIIPVQSLLSFKRHSANNPRGCSAYMTGLHSTSAPIILHRCADGFRPATRRGFGVPEVSGLGASRPIISDQPQQASTNVEVQTLSKGKNGVVLLLWGHLIIRARLFALACMNSTCRPASSVASRLRFQEVAFRSSDSEKRKLEHCITCGSGRMK